MGGGGGGKAGVVYLIGGGGGGGVENSPTAADAPCSGVNSPFLTLYRSPERNSLKSSFFRRF